jgi:hypothetical protein
VIACTVAALCLLAPASPAAEAGRPLVSLVATPSHVQLAGTARQMVRIENTGSQPVVVDVSRAGFALDLRGRPRVAPRRGERAAASWLTIRPRRLALPPGKSRPLTILARVPRKAEPGDHDALVLLTTRPRRRGTLAVRMRLGVVVVVRAPGQIVRRLRPVRLRVRRAGRARVLELLVVNRGNVTETVGRGCATILLRRRGRLLTRLAPAPRPFLPRSRGIAELRYRGPLRGWMLAQVGAAKRPECPRFPSRVFRIRL